MKRVVSHLPNHFSIYCIQPEHNLCVFWIFLLASHAVLGCQCEGPFRTLSIYSTTLSMAMISIGSDYVSRIRRVYTWRNVVRKMLLNIFKILSSRSRDATSPYLNPIEKQLYPPKCQSCFFLMTQHFNCICSGVAHCCIYCMVLSFLGFLQA